MSKKEIKLKQEIKSLGWVLILFGVVHIIASEFLSFFWGFVLIAFGIFSLISKKQVVLLIFGILILVAGLSNIFNSVISLYLEEGGFSYFWLIFGGAQIWWGTTEIIKYNKLKKVLKIKKKKVKKDYSIASLVLGICSILFSWFIALVGVVCGILAIIFAVKQRKIKITGMANAGLITGIVGLIISVIVWIISLFILGIYW